MLEMDFVDISIGTITEFQVYGSPTLQLLDEQRESDSVWRFYSTLPIGEFFAKGRDKMEGKGVSRTWIAC